MLNYFPKFFTKRAIILYFITLASVTLIFFRHSLSVLWMIFGIVSVIGFFYYANVLTKKWANLSPKSYKKKLLITSSVLRLVWVVFSFFFYNSMTGKPFEFGAADSMFYHEIGKFGASLISKGDFNFLHEFDRYAGGLGISDSGYPIYLSFIYFLTGNSILITRLLKVVWSTWTILLVYKIASRNFGEHTGRIAGILAMLLPNLILYCGLHLKEVEMVFLVTAFVERADYLLRSKNFSLKNILIPLLIAILLFFFRTVLGATALFALLSALLFSTQKILGFGQRFIIGVWVAVAIVYFLGGRISTEVEQVWSERFTGQQTSMEWRAQREGGNRFSDRIDVYVFAPAIFIIPIPTMVDITGQENQLLIHGGNYVKDILAFFMAFFAVLIIKRKQWRDFMLIEAFFLGYLTIIAFSAFAQSERFHQPILPLYMIFAAYGISNVTNKTKKYFNWYLVGLFAVFIVWNWFKLAGRGLA